jgi:Domain of unknown function (DUF5655)
MPQLAPPLTRALAPAFRPVQRQCESVKSSMARRQCYHCKQWIEAGTAHDCWTTTESALTRDLPEDLQDAWERLRETAAEFGEQRIYASHHSIMFSGKSCYFFVRPKKSYLEVCVFLDRAIKDPRVRRVDRASSTRVVNVIRIVHRDEVESPITDWLRRAYDLNVVAPSDRTKRASTKTPRRIKRKRPAARRRRVQQEDS